MLTNQSLLHDIVLAIDFEAAKKQEPTVVMESEHTFTGQASTSRLQGTCLVLNRGCGAVAMPLIHSLDGFAGQGVHLAHTHTHTLFF